MKSTNFKPRTIAILCLLMGSLINTLVHFIGNEGKSKEYYDTYAHAFNATSKITTELHSRINLNQALSAYVEENPKISQGEFESFVTALIKNDAGVVSSMSFEHHFIIVLIAPFEFNKKALGLDLTVKPGRAANLKRAIESKKAYIEGPFELAQDNMGIVSYIPVYFKDNVTGNLKPVGVTDVVLLWEKFLEVIKLEEEEKYIDIAIRGENGMGNEGEVFYGDPELFEKENAVRITIPLPLGEWIFVAYPKDGYKLMNVPISVVASYIFVILFSILVYFMCNTRISNKNKMIR